MNRDEESLLGRLTIYPVDAFPRYGRGGHDLLRELWSWTSCFVLVGDGDPLGDLELPAELRHSHLFDVVSQRHVTESTQCV